MKKKGNLFWALALLATVLAVFCLFAACSSDPKESGNNKIEVNEADPDSVGKITADSGKWNVLFDSKGGTWVATQTPNRGAAIEEPAVPVKSGYAFLGWYSHEYCNDPYFEGVLEKVGMTPDDYKWDFSSPVHENMILYARWQGGEKWFPTFSRWLGWKYWDSFGQIVELNEGWYDAGMIVFANPGDNPAGMEESWFGVFRYAEEGLPLPAVVSGNSFTYIDDGQGGYNIPEVEFAKRIWLRNTHRKYVTKPVEGMSIYEKANKDSLDYTDSVTEYGFDPDEFGPIRLFDSGTTLKGGFIRGDYTGEGDYKIPLRKDMTFYVDQKAYYYVCHEQGIGNHGDLGGQLLVSEIYIRKHGNANNLLKNGDFLFMDYAELQEKIIVSDASAIGGDDFRIAPDVLVASGPNPEIRDKDNPAKTWGVGKWYLFNKGQGAWLQPYFSEQWDQGPGTGFAEDVFPRQGDVMDYPEDELIQEWFK